MKTEDLINIPEGTRDSTIGPPAYAGEVLQRHLRNGGVLHRDTETGGVCVVRSDSSFKTSFWVERFDSLEAYEINDGSFARKGSTDIRAKYLAGDLERLSIERTWEEVESCGLKKFEYQHRCRCSETGERLVYPNQVRFMYSKADGYVPFKR